MPERRMNRLRGRRPPARPALLAGAALLAAAVQAACARDAQRPPRAVNGIMDLSAWSFSTHGAARLDGEWEFYWHALADPATLGGATAPAPSLRRLPGLWNRPRTGERRHPANGYATYSLRLTGLSPGIPFSLSIPEMRTAYRMWFDTLEIASNGTVARDKEHSHPQYLPQSVTVIPPHAQARITVQVSNFFAPSGGIPHSIAAGTQRQILQGAVDRRGFNVFMIGALLVISIYYTGLFALGKRENAHLYLGILGAILIAKSLVVGDRLLVQFFPEFPWGLLQKIETIPVYLGVMFYAVFFWTLYPKEIARWAFLAILWFTIGTTASFAALPVKAMFMIHGVAQHLRLAGGLYAVFVLALAIKRKRDGAAAIGLGFLFQLCTITLDTLNEKDIFQSVYLSHAGLIAFSLFAGSVITRRFILAERRARERQDQLAHIEKLAALGTVVAGVAHEINNPNNSIQLDAQTQSKALSELFDAIDDQEKGDLRIGGYRYGDLKADLLAAADRMIRNARRISRIVSNLRALGKKDVPMNEDIDLNAVVMSALEVVDHVVKRSTRALRLELAPDLPIVKGNSQYLEQVVINLVRNACQALPDMDRAVTISTVFDEGRRLASLTVADEGAGMDEEARANALTPYFTTKGKEGSGLGLSICKNIINLHRGTIDLESAPGKGTAIRIALPVTPAQVQAVSGF